MYDFWGQVPLKFGRAKTSISRRNFGQLRNSIANISGTDQDIDKRKSRYQLLSLPRSRKKLVNFGPLTKKCAANVYPPKMNVARAVWANAIAFAGWRC